MLKAVIFDMGGVILDLDMDRCVRNFKEVAGFSDIVEYLDIYHQKGFIGDFEEGILSEDEFYAECLRHCKEGTSPRDIEYCFNSLIAGPDHDVIRQIRELSRDYDLYVLSNNNPICSRKFLEILDEEGIASCFKGLFFSFRMKMLKPGREIYDEAVRRTGLRPEEILFIDDSAVNVEGAKAAGLNAILFKKGDNVLSEYYLPRPAVH